MHRFLFLILITMTLMMPVERIRTQIQSRKKPLQDTQINP